MSRGLAGAVEQARRDAVEQARHNGRQLFAGIIQVCSDQRAPTSGWSPT